MAYINTDEQDVSFSEDTLWAIRSVGLGFLSQGGDPADLSKGDRYERRANNEARYAAQRYVAEASNKPFAFWEVFEAVYGSALELNEWTKRMTLRGRIGEASADDLLADLEKAMKMAAPLQSEFFYRQLGRLLKLRMYSPVKRYLQRLPKMTPETFPEWNTLALKLFGTNDLLAQTYLTKWLVAAVARVIEPGCKADNALILKSEQGAGKQKLLKALFGECHKEVTASQPLVEQQRIMQQAWCVEMGEIDSTFRAKDVEQLKQFITMTEDDYRDMRKDYEGSRPRHCVFAGSTNKEAFLNDPTGSRRFWIIDIALNEFDIEWIKANRDSIWATAYHLYSQGEQWWLTRDEDAVRSETNQLFAEVDVHAERLEDLMAFLESHFGNVAVKASDVMTFLQSCDRSFKSQNRLAQMLANLGYSRKKFNNKEMDGQSYVKAEGELVPFRLTMLDAYQNHKAR